MYQRIHLVTARRAAAKLANRLSHTLLFKRAEESLDHPVLLWRVRRDVLLAQPVVPARLAESARLEDEPVVGSDYRSQARRAQRAEAFDARRFEGALRLACSQAQSELVANDAAVMAVDDRHQVSPALTAAVDVGDVHRVLLAFATEPFARTRGRGVRRRLFTNQPFSFSTR